MERLRETYLYFQPNLPYFEDAFIGVSCLFKYFLSNLANGIKESTFHQNLFDDSADDCDIFYYAFVRGTTGCDFMEIPLDIINYVSSFKGLRKELLLKR